MFPLLILGEDVEPKEPKEETSDDREPGEMNELANENYDAFDS